MSTPQGPPAEMDAGALLAWFEATRRVLPWREEPRDAYRTWISEAMLQQTRVETVLRYYDPFLRAFPTLEALAGAPEERLMKAWEGLGYYRRARLLRDAARAVLDRHGGRLPADAAALRALPGFGPYTAGAVASLAFGLPEPAVDGNVLRVVARLEAWRDDVGLPATRRKAEAWVRARQPPDGAGAFNEALMELGATVCTPRSPRCGDCPLAQACAGRAQGLQARLPVKARKPPAPTVRVAIALARRGDRVLLERRESGLLAGTWGLPWVEVPGGEAPEDALAGHLARLVGATPLVRPDVVATHEHVFTHRRWRMEAYAVEIEGLLDGAGMSPTAAWHRPGDVALGTAHRRVLDKVA